MAMDVAPGDFDEIRRGGESTAATAPELPILSDQASPNIHALRGIAAIAASSAATVAMSTFVITKSTFAAAAIGVLAGAGVILAALMIGNGA